MPADLELLKAPLPKHVAIIMDGNGRWAEMRNRPRLYGHREGASSVREIVEVAGEVGIEVLTLYAFSSENWKRPEEEVSGLMSILKNYLESELNRMLKNNIRLSCIGNLEKIPGSVRKVLLNTIERTKDNNKLILNLALSYGARDEIALAARSIAEQCLAGRLSPDDVAPEVVRKNLYTSHLKDPDLLIRTGGEQRLSNFLLWQASYSEIIFTETMWPDYRRTTFLESLREFQNRERRFGKTGAQLRTG